MWYKTSVNRFLKRTSSRVIGGLLIANMLAYLASYTYVGARHSNESAHRSDKDKNLIESGWQVMHWSYSLLEYFRHSNPVDNR